VISDAIFAQLTNDPAVGPLIGTRLYPQYDRQNSRTYPLCVYKFAKAPGGSTNQGPINLSSSVLIIAAIATTYIACETLANAIVACLDSARWTTGGTIVQGTFLKEGDGIDDDVVTDPTTEEILYHVKRISFDVRYTET
jgi:hypothetical protein